MLAENSGIALESDEKPRDDVNNIEFTKYDPVKSFADRKTILWRIQSWDKKSIEGNISTSYVELPNIGNPVSIMNDINKKEFIQIFKALRNDEGLEGKFIGSISISKDENGEEHFVGSIPNSKECTDILEDVQNSINKFENDYRIPSKKDVDQDRSNVQQKNDNEGR